MKKLTLLLIISLITMISFGKERRKERKQQDIELTDTIPQIQCDTIYGGYVRMHAVFEPYNETRVPTTFIVTDSTTCTVIGAIYDLPHDKLTYVYVYDNDRRTAEFTWEGEDKTYKIWK